MIDYPTIFIIILSTNLFFIVWNKIWIRALIELSKSIIRQQKSKVVSWFLENGHTLGHEAYEKYELYIESAIEEIHVLKLSKFTEIKDRLDTLRAYSVWSKNYGEEMYQTIRKTEIVVINTFYMQSFLRNPLTALGVLTVVSVLIVVSIVDFVTLKRFNFGAFCKNFFKKYIFVE